MLTADLLRLTACAATAAFDGSLAADGLTAEPRGGEPSFVPGLRGQALRIGDGRFVSFGATPELDLPEVSVALLIQLTRSPALGYNPCLIAKRQERVARWSVHVNADARMVDVWNGASVAFYETPDLQPLELGRWYHLALTFGPRETLVYLDGAPCRLARGESIADAGRTGLPLLLGASSLEGGELFEGLLVDQLEVVPGLRSPEAVAEAVDELGWAERRRELTRLVMAREAEQRRLAAEREERRQGRIEAMLATTPLEVGDETVYAGERLSAISLPVGGIGGGCIQVNGAGELAIWQIFGNHQPVRVPDSFLGLLVTERGREPVVRALQTAAMGPFAPLAEVTVTSRYPFGTWRFTDPALPVGVEVRYYNPLIPLNERDSALPCLIAEVSIVNPTPDPIEVTVFASQLNPVGYRGDGAIDGRRHAGFQGNRNELVQVGGGLALHCTGAAAGNLTLAATAPGGWLRGVTDSAGLDALHAELLAGRLSDTPAAGPADDGSTLAGAVAATTNLAAGANETVRFVLAWSFPEVEHGQPNTGWTHRGWQYTNWWPDSLATAAEVLERGDALRDATESYTTALYASELPRYVLDRLANQVAILRSMTCWWAADGYFGGWEGCSEGSGCCFGNCGHVWHYAQAHARLFPALARRMREQALRARRDDGALYFRQPRTGIAADGILGEILETYREHLTAPDEDWLSGQWPRVRDAVEFVIAEWDADEDGLFSGPQHNTLDAELGGASSWMGTLWLAALEAGARMAEQCGEAGAAERYRRIRAAGVANQEARLYNGEYYIQVPDAVPQRDYNDGCHIDQLLGEWWADQLDLPWVYSLERKQSALRALLRHNFQPDFDGVDQAPRKFVADEDAGLQMITWPRGGRPPQPMLYHSEVMTGFEYAAAATMIQHGLPREGLTIVKAIADRYDGRLRTGLTGGGTASWGYSGNPFGDDECGKFYARAMSSWSLLTALQGFLHDAPAGLLGFLPRWRPDDHRSFFAAGTGWGLFNQQNAGAERVSTIELRAGELTLRRLILGRPAGTTALEIRLQKDGADLAVEVGQDGERLVIDLAEPLSTAAGETLRAVVAR